MPKIIRKINRSMYKVFQRLSVRVLQYCGAQTAEVTEPFPRVLREQDERFLQAWEGVCISGEGLQIPGVWFVSDRRMKQEMGMWVGASSAVMRTLLWSSMMKMQLNPKAKHSKAFQLSLTITTWILTEGARFSAQVTQMTSVGSGVIILGPAANHMGLNVSLNASPYSASSEDPPLRTWWSLVMSRAHSLDSNLRLLCGTMAW